MALTTHASHAGLAVIHFRQQALMLLGRLLLLSLLFLGTVTAIEAAGGSANQTMMTGIVTGDAADHCALQAAPGIGGRRGRQRQRGSGK